jgi:Mg-chelatase subunit ChlD
LFNTYENSNLKSDERIIIFCIDTSGSMAGPRINSVKNACLKTIEQLCNQDNSKIKVALVTFDSTSKYYGNGDLNESTITKQNWYDKSEQTMGKIKQYAQELLTVNKSATLIKHRLEKLDADGGTSICDALAHSVLLASMVIYYYIKNN